MAYYDRFKSKDLKIYAFEPNPLAYKYAKELYNANNINNITLENTAVGDKNEELTFYYNPKHFESASLHENNINKNCVKTSVKVVRFLDYMKEHCIDCIDFIKIDIEGAEFNLLNDLYKNNKLSKIKNMFLEVHCVHSNIENTSFGRVISILEKEKFYYKIHSAGSEKDTFRLLVWASKNQIIGQ